MRAIFGDKAGDVRDTSLRVPPGVQGIVIDAKVFARRGVEKDQRSLSIEAQEMLRHKKDLQDELDVIGKGVKEKLQTLLVGKGLKTDLLDKATGDILMRENKTIRQGDIDRIAIEAWSGADLKGSMDVIESLESIINNSNGKIERPGRRSRGGVIYTHFHVSKRRYRLRYLCILFSFDGF